MSIEELKVNRSVQQFLQEFQFCADKCSSCPTVDQGRVGDQSIMLTMKDFVELEWSFPVKATENWKRRWWKGMVGRGGPGLVS